MGLCSEVLEHDQATGTMRTITEYKRLMKDRPYKWGVFDVNFTQVAPEEQYRCGRCIHFYTSLVAQRATCEIFKGRGPERKVPSAGSCMFFSRDGTRMPRIEATETRTQEPPSINKYLPEEEPDAVDEE